MRWNESRTSGAAEHAVAEGVLHVNLQPLITLRC